MQKRTQDYFDILKEELSTFPELTSIVSDVSNAQELFVKLTTQSAVAPEDLMLWVQATGCAAVGNEVAHTLMTILQEMPKRKYGSLEWYAQKAKEFQFGDELLLDRGIFYYDPVDLSHRVISQAAAVPISQGVRLKIARVVGGELAPATEDQIDALDFMFNNPERMLKPAGVHLIITSTIPDLIRLAIRVVRNPQVLADNGSLISNPAVFPVEDAIKKYIQYLPFTGEWNRTQQEDIIQAVPGVIDVEIDSAISKYGDFDWQGIDLKYRADAGYMKIDPDNPLSSTMQYQLASL